MRDKANKLPPDYEPPSFKSGALHHSKPKLTWDADNDDRKKVLSKKVTAEELKEDDFKAYLASDSGSGSDSDGENVEDVAAIRARCALIFPRLQWPTMVVWFRTRSVSYLTVQVHGKADHMAMWPAQC